MRKALTIGMVGIIGGYASIAAAADPTFNADYEKGILIKPVVREESSNLLLLPVNLRDRTFGAPFVLAHKGEWRVKSATNKTKETAGLYFSGYYLEPGDYAVLGFNTDLTQASWNSRSWFCYARAAPVVSIRAGEATVWEFGQSQEAWATQLRWFKMTAMNLPDFKPKAFNSGPVARIDFSDGAPVGAKDCTPRSFKLISSSEGGPALAPGTAPPE